MARGGIDTAFQDDAGNAINGATVEVFLVDTGTPATIYEEDGTTLLSASGTFLTGWLYGKGEILFTADNGQYDIKITNGAETRWINNKTIIDGSNLVSVTDFATTTTAGIVEKATTAEMTAGTTDKFPDAAEVKTFVNTEINALTFLNDDRVVIDFASDANYTLSTTENNYSQIEMTDTGVVLTGAVEVIIDTTPKLFSFINSTAQILTPKTSGGIGQAIPSDGLIYDLYSDGANVYYRGIQNPKIHVREEQTSGTAGGASSAGNNVRVLNTVSYNTISGASLATNQVTLPAGTYKVYARAPALRDGGHKLRLYNITDASISLVGSSEWDAPGAEYAVTYSEVRGRVSIIATKVFSLYHYINTAYATSGLGKPVTTGDVEVYSELIFEKIG